jgi:hypothetical protein
MERRSPAFSDNGYKLLVRWVFGGSAVSVAYGGEYAALALNH